MISAFIIDLRAAWRGLARSRVFLLTSSLVLGLGLAATVFMLTVANTYYFKPPPFRDGDRLYRVFGQHELTREIYDELQYLDYLELQTSDVAEDAAAVIWTSAVVTGGDTAQSIDGAEVSDNFFDLVGARAMLGRTFTERDGLPGSEPVALLSSELWSSQFASDKAIVGKRVVINGEPRTVVGILQPAFGLVGGEGIWLPIIQDPGVSSREDEAARTAWVIAKAKPGVSETQLANSLRAIASRLQKEHPRTNESLNVALLPLGAGIIGHASVSSLQRQLTLAYVTLFIACLTVAGLLFVRATYRQYETAMRSALGANRWRLVQLTLCEAIIISAFAMFVAYFASAIALQYYTYLVDAIGIYGGKPPWWTFNVDWNVASVSIAVAVVSALLAGLLPAIEASRADVGPLLRDRAHVAGSPRLTKFMGTMVVIELAAAVALLCGAILLARGAYTAIGKNLGVSAEGVMTARFELPDSRYTGPEYVQFIDSLLDRIRKRPGVAGAAITTSLPGLGTTSVHVASWGDDSVPVAQLPAAKDVWVSQGFFSGVGSQVLEGREFDSRDSAESTPVAIINAEFAARHFGDTSPLGQRISFRAADDAPMKWMIVVGVVGNVLHSSTWDTNGSFHPAVYTPLMQNEWPYLSIAVRGGGTPAEQMRLLKDEIAALDRDVPVYYVSTLEHAQSYTRSGFQLSSFAMLGFSVIAVILAIVGTYVVLSFTVEQRTKEIAIRRALGASDSQVVSTVVRGTAVQVVVGLLLGAMLTPLAVNVVSSLMEGLQTQEVWIYGMAFGLVCLAVVAASAGPARRALRVEPAILLRVD